MGLRKKERRLTIAIGLIIGITASSMLVRHALDVKEEQAAQRPGNYNTQHSAVGHVKFPPLPESVQKAIPNGIVVFFEANRSSLSPENNKIINSWVIETSGSFRSERLFILAEVSLNKTPHAQFFRASEFYVKLNDSKLRNEFDTLLNREKFKIIGKNSASFEYIVQVKNFSPSDLEIAKKFLLSLSPVRSVRLTPWVPNR
jgi:hypothetical protein